MATDMNRVTLVGRLTRDVNLKNVGSKGTSLAEFSIANSRTYMSGNGEKREDVSFFNCNLWGKQGESFAKYAKKGHRVGIEGRLQQRSWQDKNGNNQSSVSVEVDAFQLLEARPDNGGQRNNSANGNNSYSPPPPPDYTDDDVPF